MSKWGKCVPCSYKVIPVGSKKKIHHTCEENDHYRFRQLRILYTSHGGCFGCQLDHIWVIIQKMQGTPLTEYLNDLKWLNPTSTLELWHRKTHTFALGPCLILDAYIGTWKKETFTLFLFDIVFKNIHFFPGIRAHFGIPESTEDQLRHPCWLIEHFLHSWTFHS